MRRAALGVGRCAADGFRVDAVGMLFRRRTERRLERMLPNEEGSIPRQARNTSCSRGRLGTGRGSSCCILTAGISVSTRAVPTKTRCVSQLKTSKDILLHPAQYSSCARVKVNGISILGLEREISFKTFFICAKNGLPNVKRRQKPDDGRSAARLCSCEMGLAI